MNNKELLGMNKPQLGLNYKELSRDGAWRRVDRPTYEKFLEELRDLAPRTVECPICHATHAVEVVLEDQHGPLTEPEHRIEVHWMPTTSQISHDQRRYANVRLRCWGSGGCVSHWKDVQR